jgi:O-antigen biosynthesis protein WbqP
MYQKYVKRSLDILSALIISLLSLPIAVIVAIVIMLDDGRPVMFKQKRFGRNKQPFTIYKFRTMTTDAPSDSPTRNLLNAKSHITRSGKIIRKLSLDELPQLINVLKGEMSIIGPRPVVLKETRLIAERDRYNANSCRPGITGWAQVNGRDNVRLRQKAKMDGEYARRLGLVIDVKCLILTVYAVLSIKGHKEGADDSLAEEERMERQYNTTQSEGE